MTSLVLLGGSVSPFVRKVRVVLAEKGLEYQHEQINPFAPPEGWREISPLGKIPALRHEERVINDSSVICHYLERRFPEPALYPAADVDFARALWLEEFMDAGVVPLAGPRIFLPLALRPLMTGQEPDAAAEETAREVWEKDLAPLFDYLEGQLGDEEFFVGRRFGIADVAIASPFVNLRHAGFAPERKRWPRLRGFLERIWERASFKKPVEEETPIFGKRSVRISD
jgi:glutathione S-transferase